MHAEAAHDPRGCARDIRAAGALAGLSIKPGTPLEDWVEVLRDFDTLLVMSVEPGFGGQSFMPEVLDKVRTARRLVDTGHLTVLVEIDGGISATRSSRPPRRASTASSRARRSTAPTTRTRPSRRCGRRP